MNKIGIVVLNWQKPLLTLSTLHSILSINHSKFDYHIYLVDNGSTDNSLQQFRKNFANNPFVSIISIETNLGYVGGNNHGIKIALEDQCSHVLVINNDVIVKKDFLQKLLDFSITHPDVGILGPKIYFAPGHEFHPDRYSKSQVGKIIWSAGGQIDWNNILGSNVGVDQYDQGQFDQPNLSPDFISGCCMLITKAAIDKIGLFDVRYFMYLEDTDFCQRALHLGIKLAYVPDSVIWHINAGSSGSGSSTHDYYIIRNRLLFAERYANIRAKFALLRESTRLAFSSNYYKRRAVYDYYLRRFGKGKLL